MKRRTPISSYTVSLVAGLDEAGRGCLAGPVYAAAVILERGHGIRGLDDSKKLGPDQRERLFDKIRERALAFAIARADVDEIASLNILHASMLAMQRAAAALSPAPLLCLVDGNRLPLVLPCPGEAVIGGDGIHASIMAASILAKVARDREMQRLDAEFPGYGFARHKGYGTPVHLEALRRLGTCVQHRLGFAPCAQQLELAGVGNREWGIVEAHEMSDFDTELAIENAPAAFEDSRFPIPDFRETAPATA